MGHKTLLVAGVIVVACARGATTETPAKDDAEYVTALRAVCDVERLSGADREPDVLEKERLRDDYLAERVKHPELIYHRTLWRVQAPAERANSVRTLATEAGLPRCRYADALERMPN
jgi:hypothetical protein